MNPSRTSGFTHALGNWLGTAEVFDGKGRFLGNATDRRHVTEVVGENRVRIELSFVGPLKFAGHYFIEDHKTHRLYQGPANVGYAETLATNLIDANAYWAITGLTQRFFLMIAPDGNSQISLGLMSRGDDLMYVIVGEYHRVGEYLRIPEGQTVAGIPALVNGTHYDLQDDPLAGRDAHFLLRDGKWTGTLHTLDGDLNELPDTSYVEEVERYGIGPRNSYLDISVRGTAFDDQPRIMKVRSNNWQFWSEPGDLVGSGSMSGGRALSGHFHHLPTNLRVWRREVVTHDGTQKAVVHTWYRGGQRVGVQFGMLKHDS